MPKENIFICPDCKSYLNGLNLCLSCHIKFVAKSDIWQLMPHSLATETQESKDRWDYLYHQGISKTKKHKSLFAGYDSLGKYQYELFKHVIVQKKTGSMLEIGCGIGMSTLQASLRGWKTYGIDFSLDNLIGAKEYWQDRKQNCTLIQGDINHIPLADSSMDLVYGGGVLEHPSDTIGVVNELYRVTKPSGYCINTVPAFSLASLTYRQLSGTIPEIQILKELFTLVHIKLLKRRFMHTGLEKCFTRKYLINIHKKAGFKKVIVKHNELFVPDFENFPPIIKKMLTRLEKNWLFWAWYHVEAIK